MSQINRRFKLIVDENVAADLIHIKESDPYAHRHILVFLQEIRGDQIACENLVDEYYSDDTIENIVPFWHLQRERLNVHRIKLIEVKGWRIIVAGDHRQREVAIMAIMNRDQDYQNDNQLIKRLRKSYENLCFPRMG